MMLFSETIIKLPPGLSIISAPIYIENDDTTIIGDGVLRLADHANCPVIVIGDKNKDPKQIRNIKLINLIIDGNKDRQDSEYMTGREYLRNNCLTVRNGYNVYIENIVVYNARSGGVVFELGTDNCVINGINAFDNFWDGFAACESDHNMIRNGILQYNNAAGISLDWSTNDNTFVNLFIENNGDKGIFMRDCRRNFFKYISLKYSGVFIGTRDTNDKESACYENIFLFDSKPPSIDIDELSSKGQNKFLMQKPKD